MKIKSIVKSIIGIGLISLSLNAIAATVVPPPSALVELVNETTDSMGSMMIPAYFNAAPNGGTQFVNAQSVPVSCLSQNYCSLPVEMKNISTGVITDVGYLMVNMVDLGIMSFTAIPQSLYYIKISNPNNQIIITNIAGKAK